MRVAKQRGGAYRYAIALPGVGFFASMAGGMLTLMGLIHAFGAVANAPPDVRASALADGISEAMNGTAYGLVAAILLYLTSAILSSVGSRRAREAR